MTIKPIEIEYKELVSGPAIAGKYRNYQYGIRITTTPETYAADYAELVIEVKQKLHDLVDHGQTKTRKGSGVS